MTRFLQVNQGRVLVGARGEHIAGGGERVPADHPAVFALEEPSSVGFWVDDPPEIPVEPSVEASAEAGKAEAPAPKHVPWFRRGRESEPEHSGS